MKEIVEFKEKEILHKMQQVTLRKYKKINYEKNKNNN